MPSARRRLGDLGERLALAHLRARGYTILAQNWRIAIGEIDLVAREGDQVVFVEVRTRRGAAPSPEESVSPRKQQRLIALAYSYLAEHQLPDDTPWRIDVIAVRLGADGPAQINHLVSAVEG